MQTFSATVTGTPRTVVTWSVDEPNGGSINASGVYTAPAVAGTFHVRATAQADATASKTASVQVQSSGTAPPTIGSFTANPTTIQVGGSSVLSWSTSGATSVNIDNGVGTVASFGTRSVSPAASTTYTLTATNSGGTVTASLTVIVTGSVVADATISIDTSQDRKSISPFVYGYNAGSSAGAPAGATWLRLGGNRWTAYNWTNNYSNAGSDYGPYHNDNLMGSPSDGPGHAAVPAIDDAKAHGLGLQVAIPIQGWVSKVRTGNVPLSDPITDWFVPNQAQKGSPFTATPAPDSSPVWQDEFANFLANRWGSGPIPIHFSLDNEPDLWFSTHREIQRTALRYTDLLSLSVAAADAIKQAVPSSLVFGPVSYGWAGYMNLQGAPDAATYGDFLNYYLDQMSAAESSRGRRLVDVLDLHFYSESRGCGTRVNDSGPTPAVRNGDCVVAARVQSTRSLWDPSYREPSWITGCCTGGQGIQLIPRMFTKIAAHYAGTKLAITEYNHGGGDHISGAVAEADSLGAMGREGVFAASYWPLLPSDSWTFAAFRAFRNYDAQGSNYPDTAVRASSSDIAHLASYAGLDSATGRVVVVLVHRPGAVTDAGGNITGSDGLTPRTVLVQLTHPQTLQTVRAWQLAGGSTPVWNTLSLSVGGNALTVVLPPLSVTIIELKP